MQLSDALGNVADQDKGRWLDVLDPWTGKPTGFRFLLAGPDSDVQCRARITMMDELAEASSGGGTVSFEVRESIRVACLARCVLAWDVADDGQPVAFSHKNVVRVLKGVRWLQAQVDAFAGERRNYAPEVSK